MPDNHAAFESDSLKTPAVLARATKPGPGSNAVHGVTSSAQDSAIFGEHTASGIGVFGQGGPNGGDGVFGRTGTTGSGGVHGQNTANGPGVIGDSTDGTGVYGIGLLDGVFGMGDRTGIFGWTGNVEGTAVLGINTGGGPSGVFDTDIHVEGQVFANSAFVNTVVTTDTLRTHSIQGWPPGPINVPATLYVQELISPLKFFRIDHPQDPANKFLNHACVESSEQKNVYDGLVVLDERGEAVVELPEWFGALNANVRYQLTPVGAAAPNLHVSQPVADRQFRISGGPAGLEVCWQLTGVRTDEVAQASTFTVEQDKPEHQRGRFLHPELHGQSRDQAIFPVRDKAEAAAAQQERQARFDRGRQLIAAQRQAMETYRHQAEEQARRRQLPAEPGPA